MKANKKTIFMILLLGLSVGLISLQFISPISFAPQSHQEIVNRIKIVDTRNSFSLKPIFVTSSNAVMGAELASFDYGSSYEHSTWIWQRADETEWAMTIWGASNDGKYVIEFGRVSPGGFSILYNDVSLVTFDESWVTPVAGYWWFETQ